MADSFLSKDGVSHLWEKIKSKFVAKESGKGLSTNDYTTTEKNKLAGIEAGANKYIHPSYTAKSNGLYKVTVDNTGHVSGASAVAKSDITGLGIPGSDTTYSDFTGSTTSPATEGSSGLVPAPPAGGILKLLTGAGSWESMEMTLEFQSTTSRGGRQQFKLFFLLKLQLYLLLFHNILFKYLLLFVFTLLIIQNQHFSWCESHGKSLRT